MSPLPFAALSLSRFALDEALLDRAQQSGCRVQRGVSVEGLKRSGNLWEVQVRNGDPLQSGSPLFANSVFLANGKHDLRGQPRSPGVQNDLVAFKMHWQLPPGQIESLRGFIELFLFTGGYGGLSLVEDDVANFCFVVRRATLRSAGGWDQILASILRDNPLIRERLASARPLWERPFALSSIPYGYMARRPSGLWCIGDQAAVIPSFTGDGMSIALHSAALAADMYLAGDSSSHYAHRLRKQLSRGMSIATLLSRAMVTAPARKLVPIGLSFFPGALQWIASSTRIPAQVCVKTHCKKLHPKAHPNAHRGNLP